MYPRAPAAKVLLAAAVVAAGFASAAAIRAARPSSAPVVATVTMRGVAFGADAYRVAAGRQQALRVRNADRVLHTFTVPGLGVDRVLVPGASVLVEVDPPAGRYVVYCRPHADLTQSDPTKAGMATVLVAEGDLSDLDRGGGPAAETRDSRADSIAGASPLRRGYALRVLQP